jgi:antitoxin (DNA-binding transcriptional repressor) of toxin-antitoxin stability system
LSALAEEEIVIPRRGKPAGRLVPPEDPARNRQPGALRGRFEVKDEFFEPLTDDIIDAFDESFQTRSEALLEIRTCVR